MSEDDTHLLCLDLGWAPSTRSRTAAALLTRSGRIRVAPLSSHDDAELASRLARLLHPHGLILLDIPIEGCTKLRPGGPAVRPVDRRLARAGIPVLPSVKAGMRGHQLKRAIRARARDVTIQETYPFAVLRVLWALHVSGQLGAVKRRQPGELLNGKVWRQWPPRYKRAPALGERIQALKKIQGLLTHPDLGLVFDPPLPSPSEGLSSSELARLSDCYDACLGLIPGLLGTDHPLVATVADPGGGSLLLLADSWLRARLQTPML